MLMLCLALSLIGPFSVAPAVARDETSTEQVSEDTPADEALEEEVVVEETSSEEPTTEEQPAAEIAEVEPPADEETSQDTVEEEVEVVEEVDEAEPVAPPTGSLEIQLSAENGAGLSGRFAVTDADGAYVERRTEDGEAWFSDLAAGTATVSQLAGTTDFAFDDANPNYIDVPADGHATLPITNNFLDADDDGFGDSVDVCGAGSDEFDTDADDTPDACDETPNGDTDEDGVDNLDDSTPNGDDDDDGVDNADDVCAEGDDDVDADADDTPDACDETPDGDTSEIVAEVAAEPEVVKEAPVTCQQADAVAPWIATDLADYPPGATVTLTGGNWVAGQTIEILVEDDGLADAERGPWSHTATVTADAQGGFAYGFDLAPWFVADYNVVATGECAEAKTSFTDGFTVTNATVNGGTVTTVGPGASIAAAMTINLTTAGDIWRATSWGYGGTFSCVNHTDFQGVASHTATFPITAPSSSGEYDLTLRAHTSDSCANPVAASRQLPKGVVVSTDRTATATITPTTATAGATATQFQITVRSTTNGDFIASARSSIPTGFANVQIVSVTATGPFKGGGGTWSGNTTSAAGTISLSTSNANAELANGGQVTVTFTANVPTTAGSYLWGTQAWKNSNFSSSTFAISSQPVVTVTAAQTACTPTASINGASLNFGSLAWNNGAYPSGNGGLAIQIASSGTNCTGFPTSWTVQASTGAMNRSGGGGTIPANAVSYTGNGAGSPPSGLAPSSAKSLGGTAQVIATGNATTSTGTWNAAFSLAPPTTSPPGTYTGTITITAAVGS